MKMKTSTVCLLVTCLVGAVAWPCAAGNMFEQSSLKGLNGVAVIVESLTPAAEQAGLTRALLTTDVELHLRQSSITVLTDAERLKAPGCPFLYVSVAASPKDNVFLYACSVELRQSVTLARNDIWLPGVSTWGTTCFGVASSERVRQAVRDAVDGFANDYLKANPRK